MESSRVDEILSPEQMAQVEVIVNKPWRVELTPDSTEPDKFIISYMPEIGVSSFGSTRREAYESIETAFHLYVATFVMEGRVNQLPEPDAYKQHAES